MTMQSKPVESALKKLNSRKQKPPKTATLYLVLSLGLLAGLLSPLNTAAETSPALHSTDQNQTTVDERSKQLTPEAQERRRPNWQRLARRLQLSESQTAEFIDIMSRQHQQRIDARAASGIKQTMQSIDHQVESELAAILDSNQLAQFKAQKNKRRKQRQYRKGAYK